MKRRFGSRNLGFAVLGGLAFLSAERANAVNYTNLSALTNQAASDILEMVGYGADHRAYHPASPLGLLIGLDVGMDVTAISTPQSFKDAMRLIGNNEQIPSLIPLPRFNLRKGLPFGVDVGASFITYKDIKLFGGDAQWSFFGDKGPLNAAARVGYNYAKLWYVKTTTISADVLASVGMLVVEPYFGLGWQFGSGELEVPAGSVPGGVSVNKTFSSPRLFVGVPFKLALLHITAEYGYSFDELSTYGAKVSLSF